jgi:hypothetical protein
LWFYYLYIYFSFSFDHFYSDINLVLSIFLDQNEYNVRYQQDSFGSV